MKPLTQRAPWVEGCELYVECCRSVRTSGSPVCHWLNATQGCPRLSLGLTLFIREDPILNRFHITYSLVRPSKADKSLMDPKSR